MKIAAPWMTARDGAREVVAVVLTPADRANIAAMAPDATVYCVFPGDLPAGATEAITEWMERLARGEA